MRKFSAALAAAFIAVSLAGCTSAPTAPQSPPPSAPAPSTEPATVEALAVAYLSGAPECSHVEVHDFDSHKIIGVTGNDDLWNVEFSAKRPGESSPVFGGLTIVVEDDGRLCVSDSYAR